MQYLIYCENDKKQLVAAWIEIPREFQSDGFALLQRRFVWEHGKKNPDDWNKYALLVRFQRDDKACGVPFDWGLAGSGGAAFDVFWLPEFTKEQVNEAKAKIRRDRDVVRMKVIRIREIVEFAV